MKRRNFLFSLLALGGSTFTGWSMVADHSQAGPIVDKISKTPDEWRSLLTPTQYEILRGEGTEPSFTSSLNEEKRQGIYHCAGCDLDLFSSQMKYDSGTGWPSFNDSISGHLETKVDYKLILPRTEYHCVRCGGHQGHLFDDGPPPKGQRWCNNGAALRFVAS